jgi:hypothetical protein
LAEWAVTVMINSLKLDVGSLAAQAHAMQGPRPGAYRPAGKGLRLLYPCRPFLDTPGPLSINIRAGAEEAPQNDSSEQET